MENKEKGLKKWIANISLEKKDELLLLFVSELIDNRLFDFYKHHKVPVWDATSENIDNSKRDDEL